LFPDGSFAAHLLVVHMKNRLRLAFGLVLVLVGCAAGGGPADAAVCGVTYVHEPEKEPAQEIHVVRIDLSDPRVSCTWCARLIPMARGRGRRR